MTNLGIQNRFINNFPKTSSHENKKKNEVNFGANLTPHDVITNICKLKENEVASLLGINMISMVIPQTYLDFKRNKQAGIETSIFQLGGITVNYLLYGALSSTIAFLGLKKILPNASRLINVDNKSLDVLMAHWEKATGKTNEAKIKNVVETLLNGLTAKSGTEITQALGKDKEVLEKATTALTDAISKKTKLTPDALNAIMDPIGKYFGACDKISTAVIGKKENQVISGSLENLIKNIHQVGSEVFAKHPDNVSDIVKNLKTLNKVKTGFTLGVVMALTFSIQHINKYLTEKRTGKKGFVGYSDFEKDTKTATNKTVEQKKASTAPTTEQTKGLKTKKQVSFGAGLPFPSTDQLKTFIYPAGISGRMTACRDKNEFTEAVIKVGVGFSNLMFIPALVANLAAWVVSKTTEAPQLLKDHYKPTLKQNGVEIGAIFNLSDNALERGNIGKLLEKTKTLDNIRKSILDTIKNTPLDKVRNWLIEVNDASTKSYKEIGYFAEKFVETHKGSIKDKEDIIKHLQGIKNKSIIASVLYACVTLGIVIPKGCAMWTEYKHKKELEKTGKIQSNEENPHKIFAGKLDAPKAQQSNLTPELEKLIEKFQIKKAHV